MDPNSLGAGYMAVFAVSGSVVLVALQVHKRLLSNFMKKMEFEIGKFFFIFYFILLRFVLISC